MVMHSRKFLQSKKPYSSDRALLDHSTHKNVMQVVHSKKRNRKKNNHSQIHIEQKNIHHRKPRSIGGPRSKENESEVCIIRHQYWTLITGCFNALQTTQAINCLLKTIKAPYRFYVFPKVKKKDSKNPNKSIGLTTDISLRGKVDCKKEHKKINAWDQLFAEYTPKNIQREINGVWLDPNYYLAIERI